MYPLTINYVELFKALCGDLSIPIRTQQYCLKRLSCEGITFLTVTLSKLASCVLTAIELGSIKAVKHEMTCFRWKGNALVHFDELLCKLFNKDGSVRSELCTVTLWQVRQLSQYMFKLNLDFSGEQIVSAEQSFLKIEAELQTDPWDYGFSELMRKNMETFYKFPDVSTVLSESRPRSGPGTYASQTKGETPWFAQKAKDSFADGCLRKFRSISGYFKQLPSKKGVSFLDSDTSDCSEVLFVPKDSRGPRTIVREPYFALKGQMSFFDYFSRFFQRSTKQRINFTDQSVNRTLADYGSRTGEWATLDLKEASDRVPYSLVKSLSRYVPSLRYFLKFRTSEAKLPSGERILLKKLAGMGSGLTFVWLALICHLAVATEISNRTGLTFSQASDNVFVYGDDIVVRSCHTAYALDALSKVGLLVNTKKSFYRKVLGKTSCFRESCGGDYYAGTDVGITRFKMQNCKTLVDRVTNRLTFGKQAIAISVVNAHAAEMALSGHNKTSWYLYLELERACMSSFPFSREPSSYLTRVTRKFYSVLPGKTGLYSTISVLCTRPVIGDFPEISQYFHYAKGLKAQSASPFVLDVIGKPSSSQFELTVPRELFVTRRRVSKIALTAIH